MGEITRGDEHTTLDKTAADKPTQANRVQSLVSKLWHFAIELTFPSRSHMRRRWA